MNCVYVSGLLKKKETKTEHIHVILYRHNKKKMIEMTKKKLLKK